MKTTFILHGGYTSERNESNDTFFAQMADSIPEGGTILLIYFASKEEDVARKCEDDTRRIMEFVGDKNISIVQATKESFVSELTEADVVYIRGGNTQQLKAALDTHPEFIQRMRGKTVFGSSAGAYVLSKYYFTNTLGKVMEGYGCIPARVLCHFESKRFPIPNGTDPVSELVKYDQTLELIVLRDYEWTVREV